MRNGVTPTCTNFSLRAATENLSVRLLNLLVNIDQASGPRMPRIKKLVLRDPVGVPSSCCTMTSGRTGHWTKMHQSLVKFSESEASNHTPSLADFTTTTPGLKFSVHTPPKVDRKLGLFCKKSFHNSLLYPDSSIVRKTACPGAIFGFVMGHDLRRLFV